MTPPDRSANPLSAFAGRARRGAIARRLLLLLIVAGAGVAVWLSSRPRPSPPPTASQTPPTSTDSTAPVQPPPDALLPVIKPAATKFIEPLADSYARIDPRRDGWSTEAFTEEAGAQLDAIKKAWTTGVSLETAAPAAVVDEHFACGDLRPADLTTVFDKAGFTVLRAAATTSSKPASAPGERGPARLQAAISGLNKAFAGRPPAQAKIKLIRIDPQPDGVRTLALVQLSGPGESGPTQVGATWHCLWREVKGGKPRLLSIEASDYEESIRRGPGKLFADCTMAVVGTTAAFDQHLRFGVDHWRARITRTFGLTVTGNHGLAVGDVNGDGLEDIYLCAEAGLPNRLLIQNDDGTLRDATAQSGADWLDSTSSALLIDLDGDGDLDLAIATAWNVLFMSNDGQGRFKLEHAVRCQSQLFSLAAADFDRDGDLDVYACGYYTDEAVDRGGALAIPIPFHDANNGGRNVLLRNDGRWQFSDVTAEVGLDVNNRRFSYAACWEDYDNDGLLDLYVANDFGRNNLYRNVGGRFLDVAARAGVEDMAAGMSVSWADYDNDGWMDLYVSNMFSSAGNRITYQRQFQATAGQDDKSAYQRFARGNTLFRNLGDGTFEDVSVASGTTLGRWAWGSGFADINNDGLEDVLVANGFITTDDTGDL